MNGLWANSLGMGGINPIECNWFPSKNFLELKLTGLQGDVMKESMNVAKTLAWKLTPKKVQNKSKQFEMVIKCFLVIKKHFMNRSDHLLCFVFQKW